MTLKQKFALAITLMLLAIASAHDPAKADCQADTIARVVDELSVCLLLGARVQPQR